MRLGFIVEVSPYEGLGHFFETVNIISFLYEKMAFPLRELVLFLKNASDFVNKVSTLLPVNCKNLQVVPIKTITAISIKDKMKDYNIDFLIINTRRKKRCFYEEVCRDRKTLLMFDDEIVETYNAGKVINHSIVVEDKVYLAQISKDRFYRGPKYHPLPPKILEFKRKKKRKGVKDVILTTGGTDPYRLTLKVLQFIVGLQKPNNYLTYHIVLGEEAGDGYKNKIYKLAADYNFIIIHNNLNQQQFLELVNKMDLAIISAGDTLYELAVMGVPCIVISHHMLHHRVAQAFALRNAVVNLGIGGDLTFERFKKALSEVACNEELKKNLVFNAKKITDGRGIYRVSKIIREFCKI